MGPSQAGLDAGILRLQAEAAGYMQPPIMEPKENILHLADKAVSCQREVEYGRADKDFTKTSDMLNALGFRFENKKGEVEKLGPEHVPMMMVLVKLARILNNEDYWHKDSWVDIAGYARTAEIVHDFA